MKQTTEAITLNFELEELINLTNETFSGFSTLLELYQQSDENKRLFNDTLNKIINKYPIVNIILNKYSNQ